MCACATRGHSAPSLEEKQTTKRETESKETTQRTKSKCKLDTKCDLLLSFAFPFEHGPRLERGSAAAHAPNTTS